ncbi:MAG: type II toxin-antitoxin system RelE/ParE family toxin [Ignavibacteriaceae bacterium]|jgi:plasmid stabilization system protein ParE|nr:type II toxin-antitoxin system RelE/ParE family toxin [Ignavibacteriaceae bacterium]
MKISWSPLAAERLEDIYEYISVDNKFTAKKVVERIFKKVESLSKNPERGRKVPETNREEIREVFEGEYRIIYRVESKRVSILTIRNFKQLLPEKDIK